MRRFSHTLRAAALLAGTGVITAAALVSLAERDSRASEQPAAARTLPQPVVDTHGLMELFNKPLFDFLKEAMQEQPATDEQWKTVRERGLQAAEVANLIAIRKTAAQVPQWTERAADVQRSGLALAEAARNENWQASQSAYRNLIQNCNDCHRKVAPEHAPQLQP